FQSAILDQHLSEEDADQVAVGREVHFGPVDAHGHTVRPARGTPPTSGCWSRCVVHASAAAARRTGTRPGTGAAEPVGAVLHPTWPIRTPRARTVPRAERPRTRRSPATVPASSSRG